MFQNRKIKTTAPMVIAIIRATTRGRNSWYVAIIKARISLAPICGDFVEEPWELEAAVFFRNGLKLSMTIDFTF